VIVGFVSYAEGLKWPDDGRIFPHSFQGVRGMARRKSKNDAALIGVLLLIGIPIWIVSRITDSIGSTAAIIAVVLIIAGVVFYFVQKRAARLAYLRAKYGNESIVQRIMRRNYWQGQTAEQLRDSLGNPSAVDKNLLKTRKREVWKYQPAGVNRYRLRITLDDDVVAGYGHKDS
jgi:hypothetical protein